MELGAWKVWAGRGLGGGQSPTTPAGCGVAARKPPPTRRVPARAFSKTGRLGLCRIPAEPWDATGLRTSPDLDGMWSQRAGLSASGRLPVGYNPIYPLATLENYLCTARTGSASRAGHPGRQIRDLAPDRTGSERERLTSSPRTVAARPAEVALSTCWTREMAAPCMGRGGRRQIWVPAGRRLRRDPFAPGVPGPFGRAASTAVGTPEGSRSAPQSARIRQSAFRSPEPSGV